MENNRSEQVLHFLKWYEGDIRLLYHVTARLSAKEIIESNKLVGGKGGKGVVSFTNSPRYWLGGRANIIRFVIDGHKLGNDYRIYPFINKGFLKKTQLKSEYEYRVRGPIENFLSYCIRLDWKKSLSGLHPYPTVERFLLSQKEIPVRLISIP